jgi:hypothetical protein
MPDKLRVTNSAIRASEDAVKQAQDDLTRTRYAVTTICSHATVGEAPHQQNAHVRNFPPLRVCMTCGLVEEGWSCGYLVLDNELAYSLTRDQVYDIRSVTVEQEDKGPLLRKEVTLKQLIAQKLGIEK